MLGGSNPPHSLIFNGLNVSSTGIQCIDSAGTPDFRFEPPGGAQMYFPAGILTAVDTANNSGCNIQITQAGTNTGDTVQGEILNCVIVNSGFLDDAQHFFSGKFDLTLP